MSVSLIITAIVLFAMGAFVWGTLPSDTPADSFMIDRSDWWRE